MVEDHAVANLSVVRLKNRLDHADRLEKGAEDALVEANRERWEAARDIAGLLDAGWSQRALADEISTPEKKRGQSFVWKYAEVWRKYRDPYRDRAESFNALYYLVGTISAQEERQRIIDEARATGRSVATVAAKAKKKKVLPDPSTGTRKAQVLDAVAKAGAAGATQPAIAKQLGVAGGNTICRERQALADEGWIVDTAAEGRSVWKLSVAGAAQLGLPTGWRNAKKKPKKQDGPEGETPEERSRRREREHIRASVEEEALRLGAAVKFREYAAYWRRWGGQVAKLADLSETEGCPPATQEVLVIHLDALVEHATRAAAALRERRPKEMTYYDILGVPHDATAEEIKRANRALVKQHHPDVNPVDGSRIHAINTAYDVLADPERRWLYNLYGARLRP